MDKQIDKSVLRREARIRLAKWTIAAVAVIAAIAVALNAVTRRIDPRDVTLATVDEGPLETAIPATGRVVPAYEEIINSPVSTRVLRVYAQPGDTVKAGMPLLQLDLEQEQMELDKLNDRRDMARQDLAQLRLANRTLISDLEMQVKVNEMHVNRLAIEVDNERRLDSIGSGTGDRVRQAETAYEAARLELQQLRVKLANERERTTAAERVQELNVSSADKDISLKRTTLMQGRIPAPLDGTLTFLVTDAGTRVGAGEKVAVVSDLSRFKIAGEVPEGNSSQVSVGAPVTMRLGSERLTGTVTNITPQARQGVVAFTARLDDPGNSRLRSGLRVDLSVAYGYKEQVVRIPAGNWFKGPGMYELFVMADDYTLVKRRVTTGDSNRDWVEVLSGLKPGDRVAIGDMGAHIKKDKLKLKTNN